MSVGNTKPQVNVSQVGGTAIDTNSGNKGAGTQRVVLATDQPALTNAQPINLKQLNGAAIATTTDATILKVGIADSGGNGINNGQGTMSLSVPVAIASDQSAVAVKTNPTTATGAAWTSATSQNTTQSLVAASTTQVGCSAIVVQLDQTTTITVGAVTFEGTYDDTNWITVPANQVVDPSTFAQISIPYTLQASTNKAFVVGLHGFRQVRLKLSTAITGSGSVTPYTTQVCYPEFGADYQLTSGGLTSISLGQLAGTAIDTNSGSKSAGTIRVVLATDQPQPTNKFLVDPGGSAPTKTARTIVSSQSCSAGGTVSGTLDLTTKRGCMMTMRITNGGTGPTVACTATVNYSTDNSTWRKAVAFTAGTTNSGVYDSTFEVSEKVMYLQISFTGNTGQAVTVESYGHEYTSG